MQKVVLCENIRSLHNVGAIFRNCDAAGWDMVYLCGYTGCPPDRRIEKVSLGAEETIPWEHHSEIAPLIEQLKKDDYTIYALEQSDTATDILETQITDKKIALIVGNEVEGVTPETLEVCDQHLHIPMHGDKKSLNVSVATGIAFYALNKKSS